MYGTQPHDLETDGKEKYIVIIIIIQIIRYA